jgi:hypothetical protein
MAQKQKKQQKILKQLGAEQHAAQRSVCHQRNKGEKSKTSWNCMKMKVQATRTYGTQQTQS